MSARLLSLMVVVLAALVALAVFWQPTLPAEPEIPPGPSGGDFTLQSADGPVDTATLRGKLVLIYFGYTYCPDICPTTLVEMAEVLKQLGDEAPRLQAIFVSVDPARDTVNVLKKYTAFFDPRIVGLSGSPELVQRAAKNFRVRYAKVVSPGEDPAYYAVDHSAGMYLLGPDGSFIKKFAYGRPIGDVITEIRELLQHR